MFSQRLSRQVAQILCDASHDVLWELHHGAVHSAYPYYTLVARVGEGKATNCTRRGDRNQVVITYGWKMVQSKSSRENALRWSSSREILKRSFFEGKHTFPNLLAHTVCHEFAHLIQGAEEGALLFGSVHNLDFYRILRGLHDDGSADLVREFILERCEVERIELDWSESQHLASSTTLKTPPRETLAALLPNSTCPSRQVSNSDFRVGEPVFFIDKDRGRVDGCVARVNRNTVTLDTGWRVPFHLLRRTNSPGNPKLAPTAQWTPPSSQPPTRESFRIGDRAVYVPSDGQVIRGTIKRVNRTTYTLFPDDYEIVGRYWRIGKGALNLKHDT